jgi:2,4-dienoyl-CoA reductase (NADPH2)
MEAARLAAMRGHDVSLYDKGNKLGGLLNIAAMIKGTEIECLPDFIRYFRTQLSKLGVKLKLGKEVNSSLILEVKPDVVILATGGIPAQLEISGANSPIVIKTAQLHQRVKSYLRFLSPNLLRGLTRFYLPAGKRVVILGGKIQGCELAKFLVKRNRKVTILEATHQLGEGMADQYMERLRPWLDKKGVTMLTEVQFDKISDTGITVTTQEGKRIFIEADTILPAFEAMPNHQLFLTLEGKVPEIYLIGDCKKPRRIVDAVSDAWLVGRSL